MKTVLILRHAKSSWSAGTLADHERPLNKRGERDAPLIGELLRQEELLPDLVLTSTAVRARTTAAHVVEASGYDGAVEQRADLYHASALTFVTVLQELPDEFRRVLLVAHNPGLEELVWLLTGEEQRMPTAALAQVTLSISNWSELNAYTASTKGTLVNLWRPKELNI